jgi:hypothetical protein
MYLIFVDESGDTGLIDSPSRYFILSGIVVHELTWRPALDQLVTFRKTLKAKYGMPIREEIHAGDLIRHPSHLQFVPRHHRPAILREFADEIASVKAINIINVVIDKQNKPANCDVFNIAWTTLIQRFENTMAYNNFPEPRNKEERGMLFADQTDEKKLTSLIRRMQTFNTIPHNQYYNRGFKMQPLVNVIDDPNFRDSRTSLFIQASDTVAYLLRQYLDPNSYMREKSAQNYFRRLESVLCKVASSTDPYGIVFR